MLRIQPSSNGGTPANGKIKHSIILQQSSINCVKRAGTRCLGSGGLRCSLKHKTQPLRPHSGLSMGSRGSAPGGIPKGEALRRGAGAEPRPGAGQRPARLPYSYTVRIAVSASSRPLLFSSARRMDHSFSKSSTSRSSLSQPRPEVEVSLSSSTGLGEEVTQRT